MSKLCVSIIIFCCVVPCLFNKFLFCWKGEKWRSLKILKPKHYFSIFLIKLLKNTDIAKLDETILDTISQSTSDNASFKHAVSVATCRRCILCKARGFLIFASYCSHFLFALNTILYLLSRPMIQKATSSFSLPFLHLLFILNEPSQPSTKWTPYRLQQTRAEVEIIEFIYSSSMAKCEDSYDSDMSVDFLFV